MGGIIPRQVVLCFIRKFAKQEFSSQPTVILCDFEFLPDFPL